MTDNILDRCNYRGALLLAGICLALSACAIHWPWKHKPKPAPQPVHYVSVVPEAAAISAYWDRNSLQFDLTALSGEGSATLSQIKSVGWPVRLEFLVRPGSFGQLEVVGAQRVVYEVPPQGAANLIFKLAPGVYPADTQSITLRWSAADDSRH
jgi:hypothetical protein